MKNIFLQKTFASILLTSFLVSPLLLGDLAYAQSSQKADANSILNEGIEGFSKCVETQVGVIIAEAIASMVVVIAEEYVVGSTILVNNANPADTGINTFDGLNSLGDILSQCGDQAAQGMYKGLLYSINQSMYNWAAGGFSGSPAGDNLTFLKNPDSYFKNVGNIATDQFLNEIGKQKNIFQR
jgi:hypothetical protein